MYKSIKSITFDLPTNSVDLEVECWCKEGYPEEITRVFFEETDRAVPELFLGKWKEEIFDELSKEAFLTGGFYEDSGWLLP